ncbi:MAG: hypothetical protein U1F43_16525 [Myxococcota bacterium]
MGSPDERDAPPSLAARADRPLHAAFALASLAYPVVRYHVFGAVPWKDLPLFVFDKAVCLYAVLALVATAWFRARRAPERVSAWRRTLLAATVLHVVLSLCLMGPAYFGKLYGADGRLTLAAGLGMLAGVMALAAWWGGPIRRLVDRRRTLAVGALLVAVHVAGIGLGGWLDPATWPGAMPPITLISAIGALAAVRR